MYNTSAEHRFDFKMECNRYLLDFFFLASSFIYVLNLGFMKMFLETVRINEQRFENLWEGLKWPINKLVMEIDNKKGVSQTRFYIQLEN